MNLPQKRVQVTTAKEHSKKRWEIDSSTLEQRTQPGGTYSPQEIKRSLVGSLPRKTVQEIKEHRGISSLNQTTECQSTKGLGARTFPKLPGKRKTDQNHQTESSTNKHRHRLLQREPTT